MVIVEKFKSLTPEIIHTSPSVATLLGAMIGSNQGTAVALFEKLKELKRLSENLQLLNAHDALFLLKNCFSIPKLTYTLRCTPCYNQGLLSEYDVIRSALQSILNISLSEEAWIQASLPVSNGGIGVWRAGHVALPAFLSSVESSNHLIQQLLPDRLHFISGRNDPMFLEELCQCVGDEIWHAISSTSIRNSTEILGRTISQCHPRTRSANCTWSSGKSPFNCGYSTILWSILSSDKNLKPIFLQRKNTIDINSETKSIDRSDENADEHFEEHEFYEALRQCKKNTAPGEDDISYAMLKHMSKSTLKIILNLFNLIWIAGTVPISWKHSIVVVVVVVVYLTTNQRHMGYLSSGNGHLAGRYSTP